MKTSIEITLINTEHARRLASRQLLSVLRPTPVSDDKFLVAFAFDSLLVPDWKVKQFASLSALEDELNRAFASAEVVGFETIMGTRIVGICFEFRAGSMPMLTLTFRENGITNPSTSIPSADDDLQLALTLLKNIPYTNIAWTYGS